MSATNFPTFLKLPFQAVVMKHIFWINKTIYFLYTKLNFNCPLRATVVFSSLAFTRQKFGCSQYCLFSLYILCQASRIPSKPRLLY